MSLQAKVVNRFQENGHDDRIYQPGEIYPAEGYESDDDRIFYLAEIHPKYNKIYLAEVQEIESAAGPVKDSAVKEQDDTEKTFPHHVGGGTYELSNGEKVKGKEEALAAESALKE
ncbi:hypothetical protein Q0V21_19430 [Paenibacillus sp. 11B]|uniref:hypothetical protein n=1 Tax=Bacillales TaxID=1385 RepID=UPI00265613F8|nr:hypothetical protein [Paenibacillus sp. 11B]MDN8590934.1 hypothetical protein [Paenibacillus sp. 11B]